MQIFRLHYMKKHHFSVADGDIKTKRDKNVAHTDLSNPSSFISTSAVSVSPAAVRDDPGDVIFFLPCRTCSTTRESNLNPH